MATPQENRLVLDTKGSLCPIPVLKTSRAIRQVKVGDVLEVLATDPGSRPDLRAWTKMTGNELVSVSEEGDRPRVYRFQIRRTR